MPKLKQKQKDLLLKKNFLDVTKLIRSIQRAEGNPDCFRSAQGYCDQLDCAWRPYCLENYSISRMKGNKTHEEG